MGESIEQYQVENMKSGAELQSKLDELPKRYEDLAPNVQTHSATMSELPMKRVWTLRIHMLSQLQAVSVDRVNEVWIMRLSFSSHTSRKVPS